MKALKFRISSPEQSERLQKVLFKLGYEWYENAKSVQYTNYPRIDTWKDGYITYDHNLESVIDGGEEKDTEKFIAKHSCGEKKIKKSKWQSVEEGLPPETNKCYLVYCAGNQCQFTAQLDKYTGKWHEWRFGPSDMVDHQSRITHWRELPNGPQSA